MRAGANLHQPAWDQWHDRLPAQVPGNPVPHPRLAGKHHGRLVALLNVSATLWAVK